MAAQLTISDGAIRALAAADTDGDGRDEIYVAVALDGEPQRTELLRVIP